MAPDVLFIGPMKSGTSWVYNYLLHHNEINLPTEVKETFYFDRNYHKGLGWYTDHWDKKPSSINKTAVEVAPSYFVNTEIPERIVDDIGELKLVVTFRDPVRRAWSHYMHLKRYGYTDQSLKRTSETFPQLLESSRYNKHLNNWLSSFSESNVHVLWFEDMVEDVDNYAHSICNILNISYLPLSDDMKNKKNEAAVPASRKLASAGRQLSYWLKDRRLYGLINLAKKIGLHNIFFGKPGSRPLPGMTEDERIWLMEQLKPDYDQLPEKYRNRHIKLGL